MDCQKKGLGVGKCHDQSEAGTCAFFSRTSSNSFCLARIASFTLLALCGMYTQENRRGRGEGFANNINANETKDEE